MRITQQESGTNPLDPCAAFAWGSVMDFSITILNGFDCSAYTGDNLMDAIVAPSLPYSDSGQNVIATLISGLRIILQMYIIPLQQVLTQ